MVVEKPTCFWRSRLFDRAVLHQRDAVGRGDGHQFDVDLGQLEFSLDAFDGLEHQFMRITDDLLLVVVIREGNRRFAVAEGDGAGVLDLFQGQGFLRLSRQNSGSTQGGGNCGGNGKFFHVVSCWGKEAAEWLRCLLVCRGRASYGHLLKEGRSTGFIGFYPMEENVTIGIPSPTFLPTSDFRQLECCGQH
jgi:hypothetical protein